MADFAIKFAHNAAGDKIEPAQIPKHSKDELTDLTCGGCTAEVGANHGGPLRSGGTRRPHFKLRKGHTHDLRCAFDLVVVVETKLRERRYVRKRATDGRWELLLPQQVFRASREENDLDEAAPGPTELRSQKTHTVGVSRRLALLNDVTEVIELLHHHRDHPRAADLFKAVWRGTEITWDDFYYTPDRHPELFRRVEKRGPRPKPVSVRARRPGTAPAPRWDGIPAAVTGQVTFFGDVEQTNSTPPRSYRTLYLALDTDNRALTTRLVVRAHPDLIPADIEVGKAVVVLAQWEWFVPRTKTTDKKTGARKTKTTDTATAYCCGWLKGPRQIGLVDDDVLDS